MASPWRTTTRPLPLSAICTQRHAHRVRAWIAYAGSLTGRRSPCDYARPACSAISYIGHLKLASFQRKRLVPEDGPGSAHQTQ
eukprot:366410-Chlamydomonas_euryale.AAC.20